MSWRVTICLWPWPERWVPWLAPGVFWPTGGCHLLGQRLIRAWWHEPLKIFPCPPLWPCLELEILFFKNTSYIKKNVPSSCQPVSWVWLAWTNHPELHWTHKIELLNPKIWRSWWSCQGASQWAPASLELLQTKILEATGKHSENPCNN